MLKERRISTAMTIEAMAFALTSRNMVPKKDKTTVARSMRKHKMHASFCRRMAALAAWTSCQDNCRSCIKPRRTGTTTTLAGTKVTKKGSFGPKLVRMGPILGHPEMLAGAFKMLRKKHSNLNTG